MCKERFVLHADMDAFFASVETRDEPSLRGRPVIVAGLSRRGVVAAASYEAREFGVRSAMPTFRARELCPEGVFISPDMERYSRVSASVHEVFETFTSQIEPIALDEAFLDVTGSVNLFGGVEALARSLKARVREVTGLVVSVGVGPNKMAAKIACTSGKPDGLVIIPKSKLLGWLEPFSVRRIWGVGPVAALQLECQGIETIGQLSRTPLGELESILGSRAAEVRQLARGNDVRQVEHERIPRSYGEESTFEKDVCERQLVTEALTAHAEAVARRLRHDGYAARTIVLKVKLGRSRGRRLDRNLAGGGAPDYPLLTRRRTLSSATSDGAEIRRVAIELWDALGRTDGVRLLGISAMGLQDRTPQQLDLFADEPASARLGPTLDAIERKFGRGAVHRGLQEPKKMTPSAQKKRGQW